MYKLHGDGKSYSFPGAVIENTVRIFHPSRIEIGEGTYISNQTILKGYLHNGLFSIRIGKRCWIGENCYLHGAGTIEIEDRVGIGPGVYMITSCHNLENRENVLDQPLEFSGIKIKQGADLGTRSIILPGITIGQGAVIGAGSVVTQNVPDFAIVAGNPAKVLRIRPETKPNIFQAGL
jgi:acetyltransferase-like isoleucine patch superfamily enzyme